MMSATSSLPSPLVEEGGERGAIASASRVRGRRFNLNTDPSPALARLRLREGTLSHKGRGKECALLAQTFPRKRGEVKARYVILLSLAFDPDQLRHARLRDRAATSHPMEAVMRNVTARVIARPASHGIAMEWSMALWVLALAFLLATLQVY